MGRIVVNHNMQSMYQHRQLKINTENVDKSSEKLASGYKINHANDEAAELTVSETMRNQIRGLNKASNNIQDGIDSRCGIGRDPDDIGSYGRTDNTGCK